MQDHSTRTSRDKKGLAALKPFLMIGVFMILTAAFLIVMEALGSGTSPVDWSWVLYVGGALALFAVLALRAKNRTPLGDRTDRVELEDLQAEHDEEKGEKLDDIRSRIRQRKIDKRT